MLSDPAQAIGSAKELVETCCKTILSECGKPCTDKPDVLPLVRRTMEELQLLPDGIPESAKGSRAIKALWATSARSSKAWPNCGTCTARGTEKTGGPRAFARATRGWPWAPRRPWRSFSSTRTATEPPRRACPQRCRSTRRARAMPVTVSEEPRTITEVTRRNITESLIHERISWHGQVDDVTFLKKLFPLAALPSNDRRCKTAEGDIFTHRISFQDWPDEWVYDDPRFGLMHCPDELFLNFLCLVVDPRVRRDRESAAKAKDIFNRFLAVDGWQLAEKTTISGYPVYTARRLLVNEQLTLGAARAMAESIDADYVARQINRLESAIDQDPELAIGTGKEFVETICKTILDERKEPYDRTLEFPRLVRATIHALQLVPDDVPGHAKTSETLRHLLGRLAAISNDLAEQRNQMGTGHGRHAAAKGPRQRHARLAVASAVALALFLFETHTEKSEPS